jgi:hypothetical protein
MTDKEALKGRIDQLIELDESRRKDLDQMARNQDKIKGTFDHKARQRNFEDGDLLLMWGKRKEKPRMHKKFDRLWFGPYRIEKKSGINSFYLTTPKGEKIPLPVNGYLLKPYFAEGT